MGVVDIVVFVVFVFGVVGLGLWMSRTPAGEEQEGGAQDYFLAGRKLTWWLVGFSLIAANISTEQFVGMSGKAAEWLGMAIASYEWLASIVLVIVAFVFLPTFLKSGIFTIPEFLEHRYNPFARVIMAVSTIVILVGVPTASVVFSGAKVVSVFFHETTFLGLELGNLTVACWIIGVMAAVYVFAGGLKACAWADLVQGTALIAGGFIIAYLAMDALVQADPTELAKTAANPDVDLARLRDSGAIGRFVELNSGALPEGKLHMVRPADDPELPWSALVVGLWIPVFFYWGLNQYITQRTLGSRTLAEGQRGVVFAAFLKLLIPFAVVVPGMLAFNLFGGDLAERANDKNASTIASLESGAKQAYRFNEDFAERHPLLAQKAIAHNRTLLGQAPKAATQEAVMALRARPGLTDGPSASESDTGAQTISKEEATSLLETNAALVAEAELQGAAISEPLVGYDFDAAFPTLLSRLLKPGSGLLGFVLAAIFGAVASSLASMLNSASTIFTMDLYRKVRSEATPSELVRVGRTCVVVFALIAILIAPSLDSPKFGGIFTFIQEFQGFISPGILAIFVFGLAVPRAPRITGTVGLLLNPVLYGILKFAVPEVAFLDRMAICFVAVIIVLTAIRMLRPLDEPVKLPVNDQMDMTPSRTTKFFGGAVVAMTAVLYAIFW